MLQHTSPWATAHPTRSLRQATSAISLARRFIQPHRIGDSQPLGELSFAGGGRRLSRLFRSAQQQRHSSGISTPWSAPRRHHGTALVDGRARQLLFATYQRLGDNPGSDRYLNPRHPSIASAPLISAICGGKLDIEGAYVYARHVLQPRLWRRLHQRLRHSTERPRLLPLGPNDALSYSSAFAVQGKYAYAGSAALYIQDISNPSILLRCTLLCQQE